MNLGGEPERDDSGLPPVDIEIPDDARELDRDVQAYRRELRARRRRERRMRLHAPLTRDGVVLPLLASCLVLALIAGTLLTVFTAGPNGEGDLPRQPNAAPSHSLSSARSGAPAAGANSSVAAPRDSPTASPSTHKLPDEPIVSAGQRFLLTSLVNRNSLVIALVPARCACVATVQHLTGQVLRAGLRMYLVSAKGQLSAVLPLQRKVGKAVIFAEDVSGALYSDYAGHGLTALLVHPGGSVGTVALSGQTFTLATQLAELSQEADSAQTSSPATTTSPR